MAGLHSSTSTTCDENADVGPDLLSSSVLCHPETRKRLDAIRATGLVDLFRQHTPEGGVYSWWDYRRLAFPKNDGLRINLIFGTSAVARRCNAAWIDREERRGTQPSVHAPVVVEID